MNFRAVLESTKSDDFDDVTQNAITFLRSQRMHKVSHVLVVLSDTSLTFAKTLLDRYNPVVDLTAEERIEATARRVGLNMPVTCQAK